MGCAGRFLVHYISGVTIYKILVPTAFMNWTFTSPSFYSIVYNGSYMLPNTVIALAIAALLVQADEAVYPGTGHSITPPRGGKGAPHGQNLTACCWSATLTTPSMTPHHRIPPRNLDALGRWIGQGGRFTVATGRAHRTFAPVCPSGPINAPVVLSNGSAIMTSRRRPCWSDPAG